MASLSNNTTTAIGIINVNTLRDGVTGQVIFTNSNTEYVEIMYYIVTGPGAGNLVIRHADGVTTTPLFFLTAVPVSTNPNYDDSGNLKLGGTYAKMPPGSSLVFTSTVGSGFTNTVRLFGISYYNTP